MVGTMSTLQVPQTLSFPKDLHRRVAAAPKRPMRPERTEISQIYQNPDNEKTHHHDKPISKLESIKGDILSPELLNQYNEIVGPTESLAVKKLPPVKISYQSIKHKFVESPHTEGTSRIIRPHLTMKTYSPGHHIFTEGLSKNSMVRSPTFALQQVGVPYSNLPDSISIYKEKDKFAFGVNDDFEKSPYRLTPKPFKVGSATFIPALEPEPGKPYPHTENEKYLKAKRSSKYSLERPLLELRSNVIKLEPLALLEDKDGKHGSRNKAEFSTDIVNVPAGYTKPSKSPLAPSNSFYLTEPETEVEIDIKPKLIKETDLDRDEKTLKLEKQERKLSVVSIGETVGPSFFDSKKKEARQLYPMYDNMARLNENYRRKKFEYSEDFNFKAKPQVPSSTFTYKVSMQGLTFLQDKPPNDFFKPIRNNLRDRNGNVIHKQRCLGKYSSTNKDDEYKTSSDYNFRRYYRRVFRRPKSSDSLSTDFSQVPGNPPPSEISHILSEDGHLLVNDIRNGMVTLLEERTLTASMMSPRKENTPVGGINADSHKAANPDNHNIEEMDENIGSKLTGRTGEETETCTDTDIQFENAIKTVEMYKEQEIDSSRTEFEKTVALDNAVSTEEKVKAQTCERAIKEKSDSSVVEKYIAEAEERIKTFSASDERDQRQPHTVYTDKIAYSNNTSEVGAYTAVQTNIKNFEKLKSNSNKQLLAVPTFSLDSIHYKPAFQLSKERTSLSRSIQNMTVPDAIIKRSVSKVVQNLAPSSEGKIGENGEKTENEGKTSIPVARLRFFSDTSDTMVSLKAPSVSLIDENGDMQEVCDNDLNNSRATDQSTKEKKVVSNANIPFIYPSTSEVKAKRH